MSTAPPRTFRPSRFATIVVWSIGLLALGCDGQHIDTNVRDVTHEVTPVADGVFRLTVNNPNQVSVGARFRIRVYIDGEPTADLVHVYVGARNTQTESINIPQCADDPCDVRVTATLLETYLLARTQHLSELLRGNRPLQAAHNGRES